MGTILLSATPAPAERRIAPVYEQQPRTTDSRVVDSWILPGEGCGCPLTRATNHSIEGARFRAHHFLFLYDAEGIPHTSHRPRTVTRSRDTLLRRAGALLSVGVRGARPGDPRLERDLDLCAEVGVGSVVLFDVDVPHYRALLAGGMEAAEARHRAVRNVESPEQVRALCDHLRARLGEGVVILVDQEGGQVARFRPERGFTASLPSATAFAALPAEARRAAAEAQARELADLGLDGNLAPVVDLGSRPEGPLAAKERTFSADPAVVTTCAREVIEAQRAMGLASCIKHFPGLGSADLDTHHARPVLDEAFDARVELAPWRALIADPIPPEIVMASHAVWPAVDPDRPASLSHAVLTGVIRDEMGYEGVISTDSLDMAGAGPSTALGSGSVEAAAAALRAGADLLMDAVNLAGPAEGIEHPARRLAEAVVEAVEAGAVEGGWAEIQRRAQRVRSLRRAR